MGSRTCCSAVQRPLALASPATNSLLCLCLCLLLPTALGSSSVAPSRWNPLLPRKLLTRNPSGARLRNGPVMDMLAYTTSKTWLARDQMVASPTSQALLPRQRPENQQSHSRTRGSAPWTAAQYRKRRTAARLHHAHLMRVGCALGTCQVQNLSHRLWQLKGQSGRRDASPISPNSPHSYG